jgi:L-malate glycosyltransferase
MDWPRSALFLVSSSSRTGPVEGFLSLAREVRAQGVEARFGGDTVRPGEDLAEHLALAGVPWETELRLCRKIRPLDVLHDASLLTRWAREQRFDLLQAAFAHDHHLCLWAAARARRSDLRVVRAAQRREDVEPGALRQRLWALRRSDGVVVHSESYRRRLVNLGLEPARVAAIPAGVSSVWFTPGTAPQLRRDWGVPEDAPLAGIVARMKPERAHRTLLAAFARALPSCPDAWLVLVGRGEDEEALRALARKLSPRIVFGGYWRGPGLVEAYRALDVAVWLREGNDGGCRGVLEAMACGKPVIAGSEGASGELVRDGEDGLVVAPDAEEPLAAALASLLSDLPRARAMGRSARKRAEAFTPGRAAEATLAFWRSLRALPPLSYRAADAG